MCDSVTPWTILQHVRLPCPSPSPRVCLNSFPSSWWCHPTISSSVIPFFSYPQSFLASGSFPVSRLFASGGQSIGASASASVVPINIQGWCPLGLTGLISLLFQGLSEFSPSPQFEIISSSVLTNIYTDLPWLNMGLSNISWKYCESKM